MKPLGYSQSLADRQIANLLVDEAYILDRDEVSSGSGGQKVAYTKRPAPVRCAVAPAGGGERSGRRTPLVDDRTTNVITIPAGTPITSKARIEVVGLGLFEVTAVRRRSVEIAREIEVMEAS